MFIVLKLHRQSFRQMMQQGSVTHTIKIQVMEMLQQHIGRLSRHGDIKESSVISFL